MAAGWSCGRHASLGCTRTTSSDGNGKKRMNDDRQSKQIKGSGRTYFLDVEKTKGGKPYLRITESRKGAGDRFERNSINVFPEDAEEFALAVSEMAARLSQDKTS